MDATAKESNKKPEIIVFAGPKKALYLTILMFSLLAQEVSVDVGALQGFILTQSLLI